MMRYMFLMLFLFITISLRAQYSDAPLNTRFYYNGHIENIDQVQMNLHVDQFKLTGAFLFESTGEHFLVEGRMAKDKSGIGIRLYTSDHKYVASIEAKIFSEENDSLNKLVGVYKPAHSAIKDLLLIKIAEFAKIGRLKHTPLISCVY